ncbi:DUF421 domain-containing protein [Mucilaginibacter terrae]|uniref:Uncharacterized membrane protein YcaP (DUF421 family) n=1 Tax=Mucilaginibacter terrae TaxID=1955052 RepID=A0ABU3GTZ0_9SPHI|nr:YetF domain-containing protein [Mucilaginibacter terrae]MDT3403247.1 uncharacterized membrane protein YcaP (DUF421 family) [Mucilaginibacter terrae]
MKLIQDAFGSGQDLAMLQMCIRAVVVFFMALIMVRISGRRTFGKRTAFDNTLVIILGAVLSRAIVGASPFWATICSGFLLVVLHRLLAYACIKSSFLDRHLKGMSMPLYQNGKLNKHNLTRSLLTERDIMSDVRSKGNATKLEEVHEIYMESNGEVSVIRNT